jgi:hypothetical protein
LISNSTKVYETPENPAHPLITARGGYRELKFVESGFAECLYPTHIKSRKHYG